MAGPNCDPTVNEASSLKPVNTDFRTVAHGYQRSLRNPRYETRSQSSSRSNSGEYPREM